MPNSTTPSSVAVRSVGDQVRASLRHRNRNEKIFKLVGRMAVALSLILVAVLFIDIFSKGLPGFWQTTIRLDITFDPSIVVIDPKPVQSATEADNDFRIRQLEWETAVGMINYNRLITASLTALLDDSDTQRRHLSRIVTPAERYALRDMVLADPSIIGQTRTVRLLTDANIDVWLKGKIDRSLPDHQQQLDPVVRRWADNLYARGIIENRFSTALFVNPDSRSSPASAGLAGALVGSLYMMIIVICLAVPMGVSAAIYLEEFAPRNRLIDLIEVNINNLAAVPSIVFGLLGAAVFINGFKLPLSAPLVGGLILSLMTLPTIIIATRSTLQAIPPSIRQAALGLGASKMQTIFHHVLPIAIPGILTGAILGVARSLGETAPLLLIGMKSFVAQVARSPMDQSTALPVQIFLWQGNEMRNFFEARTSAAIIVLLVVMVVLNGLAVLLRSRFERRW